MKNSRMTYIETDNSNYYLHKFGSLLFGSLFFFGELLTLINGGTITINGVPTKANLANTSPSLLIGGAFIALFIWICFNYFKVILTDDKVKKQVVRGEKEYQWQDIEAVNEVTWIWKGTIYKFKPKNEKAFYVHTDRVKIVFNNPFKTGLNDMSYFKTKMGEFISSKKSELNI